MQLYTGEFHDHKMVNSALTCHCPPSRSFVPSTISSGRPSVPVILQVEKDVAGNKHVKNKCWTFPAQEFQWYFVKITCYPCK